MARTKLEDRVGKRFGKLIVLEARHLGGSKYEAVVQCDCGKIKTVDGHSVFRGHTSSCGCLKIDVLLKRNTSHGKRFTRPYRCWLNMKNRCNNPRSADFHNYGGRGISVCERWRNSFEAFIEDVGEGEAFLSLDRIDVNGNYEPGNVRWASAITQGNNRRGNTILTVHRQADTVSMWSRKTGIGVNTLLSRIRRGWSHEDVVLKPVDTRIWEGKMRAMDKRKKFIV